MYSSAVRLKAASPFPDPPSGFAENCAQPATKPNDSSKTLFIAATLNLRPHLEKQETLSPFSVLERHFFCKLACRIRHPPGMALDICDAPSASAPTQAQSPATDHLLPSRLGNFLHKIF